jgi:hypothetical protein
LRGAALAWPVAGAGGGSAGLAQLPNALAASAKPQDGVVRAPVPIVEAREVLAGQALQRRGRAVGGMGEASAGVDHRRVGEARHLAWFAVGHLEIVQRLLARPLQLVGGEGGAARDVGHDRQRAGQFGRHHREADG